MGEDEGVKGGGLSRLYFPCCPLNLKSLSIYIIVLLLCDTKKKKAHKSCNSEPHFSLPPPFPGQRH
jgi:hypothetical protein